jgi:aminotransferase
MTSHPGSTLLWNFPHNPTGAVDSESDRQVLRGAAAASGAEIVFDCAYADLVFDVPAETPARISSGEASVFSLSKSLGLAGERVGYVLGTEERSLEVRRAHWALAMSPPVTSQRIATAALEDESATVASLRNELENLRRIAGSHVSACHAVRYRTPAGGIFAWLEIPTLIGGDRVIAAACERTGVLVAPGQLFGVSEYTALRVSFAVPEPELRQGLEVVLKVIDRAVARSAESA